MSRRLPRVEGEWIDRGREIDFSFEGRSFRGYAGDVPSSALWAAGIRVLGRSFKYHRPRGVLSFANHDVNVLLETDSAINIRGDVEALAAGERYRVVNTFGGLKHDRARFIERLLLQGLLPAGGQFPVLGTPDPQPERARQNQHRLSDHPRHHPSTGLRCAGHWHRRRRARCRTGAGSGRQARGGGR